MDDLRFGATRVMLPAAAEHPLPETLAEAEKLLLEAGLRVGNITYQPNFDLLPNTVVDQYPRSGEPARQGQQVDLFVVEVGRPSEEIQPPGE